VFLADETNANHQSKVKSVQRIYVTNQTKLADIGGITPQHLSAIKGGKTMPSDALAVILETITGINRSTWKAHSRRLILKDELKEFFALEKQSENHLHKTQKLNL